MLVGYTDKGVFESGGAGLLSTVPDYLRFAKMLLNDGALDGARILSPNSVHMMRRDQTGDVQPLARVTSIMPGPGIGFGLGFGTITDQGLSGLALPKGSFFWGGAAGTFLGRPCKRAYRPVHDTSRAAPYHIEARFLGADLSSDK